MDRTRKNKLFYGALILLGLWVAIHYFLPLALPFILGALLALAAEPLVQVTHKQLNIRRSYCAGFGVLVTLGLLTGLAVLLGSAAFREVTVLTGKLPDMQNTAKQGLGQLHRLLDSAVEKSPDNLKGLLRQVVNTSFTDSTALMDRVAAQIPGALTGVLSIIPKGTLTVFTGILSAFMISARLPQLKEKLPASWREKYLPALARLRRGFWGWLKAQLKLMAITATVLTLGFLVLGVDYAPLVAALIALVDAVPILGTGTVLLPWALVCVLQKNTALALGLLSLYLLALTVRTVLEPRLIGKQLGLDPLLTLVAFYVGFSLWGFLGMLLAPVLATAVGTIAKGK